MAAKPKRRTCTVEYRRRTLKETDACTTPGAVGAPWRREGLYSSHLRCGGRRGGGQAGRPRAERPRPWWTPKKPGGVVRPAGGERAVLIALVEERRAQVGVGPRCAALGLARATFYRRRGAPSSEPRARRMPRAPRQALAAADPAAWINKPPGAPNSRCTREGRPANQGDSHVIRC